MVRSRIGGSLVMSPMVQWLGILLALLVQVSVAQLSASTPTSATSISSHTLLTSFKGSREVSVTSSSSTSSSEETTSAPTFDPILSDGLDDDQDSPSGDEEVARSGLLNYYFVFLAFFVLLVLLGVYLVHRRRKAQKQRDRNSGQNALARDLDGWTSTRRWMNGHWRSDSSLARDEGLDEFGQAPPPYATKSEDRIHQHGGGAESEIQLPLRTLPQDRCERSHAKPPEYSEAVGEARNPRS